MMVSFESASAFLKMPLDCKWNAKESVYILVTAFTSDLPFQVQLFIPSTGCPLHKWPLHIKAIVDLQLYHLAITLQKASLWAYPHSSLGVFSKVHGVRKGLSRFQILLWKQIVYLLPPSLYILYTLPCTIFIVNLKRVTRKRLLLCRHCRFFLLLLFR